MSFNKGKCVFQVWDAFSDSVSHPTGNSLMGPTTNCMISGSRGSESFVRPLSEQMECEGVQLFA